MRFAKRPKGAYKDIEWIRYYQYPDGSDFSVAVTLSVPEFIPLNRKLHDIARRLCYEVMVLRGFSGIRKKGWEEGWIQGGEEVKAGINYRDPRYELADMRRRVKWKGRISDQPD